MSDAKKPSKERESGLSTQESPQTKNQLFLEKLAKAALVDFDFDETLSLLQSAPDMHLPVSTILPLLVAALEEGHLDAFDGLLNTSIRYPAGTQETEIAYLSALHKDKDSKGRSKERSLFDLAHERGRMEILGCLLKHAYRQGIDIAPFYMDSSLYNSNRPLPIIKMIESLLKKVDHSQDINPLSTVFTSADKNKRNETTTTLIKTFRDMQTLAEQFFESVYPDYTPTDTMAQRVADALASCQEGWNGCWPALHRICPATAESLTFNIQNLHVPCPGKGRHTRRYNIKNPTLMEAAVCHGHLPVVQLLRQQGLSLDQLPTSQFSLLTLAKKSNHPEIATWLIANHEPSQKEAEEAPLVERAFVEGALTAAFSGKPAKTPLPGSTAPLHVRDIPAAVVAKNIAGFLTEKDVRLSLLGINKTTRTTALSRREAKIAELKQKSEQPPKGQKHHAAASSPTRQTATESPAHAPSASTSSSASTAFPAPTHASLSSPALHFKPDRKVADAPKANLKKAYKYLDILRNATSLLATGQLDNKGYRENFVQLYTLAQSDAECLALIKDNRKNELSLQDNRDFLEMTGLIKKDEYSIDELLSPKGPAKTS